MWQARVAALEAEAAQLRAARERLEAAVEEESAARRRADDGRARAEADGNRTRQTEVLGLVGVEDRGDHQVPGRLPAPAGPSCSGPQGVLETLAAGPPPSIRR